MVDQYSDQVSEKKTYLVDIPEPFHVKEFRTSVDSGAHTLYNFMFAGLSGIKGTYSRTHAKYEYMETSEFKDYLERYIEFLHKNKDHLDFYVTLDIIGNPAESWRVTEYMESCGLDPIPVFHYGEDYKWLKKMMDKYEYIGVGGLGQDITKDKFTRWADGFFWDIICDQHRHPRVKVHGFAMTSPELFSAYPWHTCDATTWTALSRNGAIYVPHKDMKRSREEDRVVYDYLKQPLSMPVTLRREKAGKHHNHMPPMYVERLKEYFGTHNLEYDRVREDYNARDLINIRYFKRMEAQAKKLFRERFGYEEGANVLLAGTPSGASTNLTKVISLLYELNEQHTRWLGSFYYNRHNENLLRLRQAHEKGVDWRKLQLKKRPVNPRRPPTERKIVSKPLPPVKFDIEVNYKFSYTVDGKYYAGLTPRQIAERELRELENHILEQLSSQSPHIELEMNQGDEEVQIDSTMPTSVKPKPNGKSTIETEPEPKGFFS